MQIEVVSNSDKMTMEIAKKYAMSIKSPTVVSLVGDLGAGKTTFAKGFAEGLEINDLITSPTFTIMNTYEGRMPLYHFDMYRVGSWDDLYSTGFFDYLGTGILAVEWSENIVSSLPDSYVRVEISKNDTQNTDSRLINITLVG